MKRILVLTSCCLCAAVGFAQAPAAKAPVATTKDPFAASLRLLVQRSQNNVVGAVESMPADKFSYKPTAEQVSFAHMVVHVIESNNALCSKVADVPASKADAPKETDSKDQLVSAVKASYAYCSDALSKMDDSKLNENIENFGGQELPRAIDVLRLASGWADHYAALAMYLRLNGILPPSAQPKK